MLAFNKAIFTIEGASIRDRLGNLWTVEQAELRLALIVDLLTDPRETEISFNVGLERFASLAAAIRTVKAAA